MLCLAQEPEADRLLSESPLALVIGMVLDQQVPLEWAFRGPSELARRLGGPLDAGALARMDPERLTALFAAKPSLHRYPAAMAKRVQALSTEIAEHYGGDAATIWTGVETGQA
ncbi:MAG: HhH-GPD-type base excision DNA repair protein, partial [Acidimicrobiales bacterium]